MVRIIQRSLRLSWGSSGLKQKFEVLVVRHGRDQWFGHCPVTLRYIDLGHRYLAGLGVVGFYFAKYQSFTSQRIVHAALSPCAVSMNDNEAVFCFTTWCLSGGNFGSSKVCFNRSVEFLNLQSGSYLCWPEYKWSENKALGLRTFLTSNYNLKDF